MELHTIPVVQQEPTTIKERLTPKLDDRFIMTIQGRDFVKYDGLLDLAHQNGLMKLEVEILQYPSSENNNTAICKAIATSNTGEIYADIGDANPGNVNRMIAPHILRMSSTRAKARVLRDFVNIGLCCVEELGDFEEENQNQSKGNNQKKTTRSSSSNPPKEQHNAPANVTEIPVNKDQNPPIINPNAELPKISEAQRRAIENLAKRRNIKPEELTQSIHNDYGKPMDQLSSQEASTLIRTLQQTA